MTGRALLLVDDEATITSALSILLAPWALANHLEILTAASADEADAVLARPGAGVCILLSDIRMPGRSGIDLVSRVKSERPEVICMLLTGLSEVEDMTRAIRAGVFSYILKPWDRGQLTAELERALDLFRLRERDREHRQRIDDELRWAAELQQALFAGRLPAVEGVRLSAFYRPLPEFGCGGDYCDVIPYADGSVTLLAGDVAGHGVRAALVASFLKALVMSASHDAAQGTGPAELGTLLASLNDRMCSSLPDSLGVLVSLAAATIHPGQRQLTVAGAGHPPPLLVRGGSSTFLHFDTLPLGAGPGSRFAPTTHDLRAGDRLVLYTDGLVEVRGASLGDGSARLCEAARSLADEADPARELVERMKPAEGYADDVTVLAAALRSSPGA